MVLVIKRRLGRIPGEAAGRRMPLRKGQPATGLDLKIVRTERELDGLRARTHALADELGREYAAFRYECKLGEPGKHIRETSLMEMSRRADDFIARVYSLEKRRRDLLERLRA